MADVTMPQLGETVTEGTITRWFKQPGEEVALDEVLFEVSTDKVDSEVPSPAAGTLTEIIVAEGETVDVGVVLAVIGDGAAAPPPAPAAPVPAPAPEPAPAPAPAPVAAPAPAPHLWRSDASTCGCSGTRRCGPRACGSSCDRRCLTFTGGPTVDH